MSLLLLLGCSDFSLFPTKEDPGAGPGVTGDSGATFHEETAPTADTSGGTTTVDDCDDTATPPGSAVWEVGTPVAATDPTVTCEAVGEVDWTLAERWRVPHSGFVMNLVVAPTDGAEYASVYVDDSAADALVVLDGRDGSVVKEIPFASTLDDGGTPAIGDMDGDGSVDFVRQTWVEVQVVDGASGSVVTFPNQSFEGDDDAVALGDTDGDGDFELVLMGVVLDADGTLAWRTGASTVGVFLSDLDGDSLPELVNGAGVWSPITGAGSVWDSPPSDTWFYGAPYDDGGVGAVAFALERGPVYVGGADGVTEAIAPNGQRGLVALADATGDGIPEVCSAYYDGVEQIGLVDVTGAAQARWDVEVQGGGCSMADLEADGVYEVIHLSRDGLHIYDGATGDVLAYEPDIATDARDSAPIVADVDGDGSAEILVATNTDVVALGPATGRWARTRPVWNQLAYDVTSIRDDGSLVSHPLPVWSTYEVFRAQPAHDGEHPDLTVTVGVTTQEWCESVSATFQVVVANTGSVETPAGAVVRLYRADAELSEEGSVSLPAIGAGDQVDVSVALDVTGWAGRWVLDVLPADGDECDWVDNRVEGSL